MITVHHLEDSRSQRVLWLLEELELAYEVKHYKRDPKTMLAPAELRNGSWPWVFKAGMHVYARVCTCVYMHACTLACTCVHVWPQGSALSLVPVPHIHTQCT